MIPVGITKIPNLLTYQIALVFPVFVVVVFFSYLPPSATFAMSDVRSYALAKLL